MKKFLFVLITGVILSAPAHATLYMLESCKFKYNMDLGKNVYEGVYKSTLSGEYYKFFFESYCPASINQ